MLLLGVMGLVDWLWLARTLTWADIVFWVQIGFGLVVLFLAWGLGLNLTLGRFVTPSQGAVDNGTACAILLDMVDRLASREIWLQRTRVTIALFAGEEVGMQGSRAYVQSRDWPLPTIAINLEIMAQDGDYVIWEHESNVLQRIPTTPELNEVISAAVIAVTGKSPQLIELVNSDAFSFLSAGIRTAVLGTYHSQMEGGGLHRPTDNIERVVMARLPEGVQVLTRVLQKYDLKELAL
jgi:Zn-dependent M28 family amino/carboxypeptidase